MTAVKEKDYLETALFAALIVGGSFCFFHLTSCAKSTFATPEYVQAIQECNKAVHIPFQVKPDGKETSSWTVEINATPESLEMVKHCYDTVAKRYDKAAIDAFTLPSVKLP